MRTRSTGTPLSGCGSSSGSRADKASCTAACARSPCSVGRHSTAAPKGFYSQLNRGQVPGWLTPVTLPKGSPYKMWRVVR